MGFSFDSMYAALGGIRLMIRQKSVNIDSTHVTINITPQVPGEYQNFLRSHPGINGMLFLGIFKGKDIVKEFNMEMTAQEITKQRSSFDMSIARRLPPGKYDIRLGIKTKDYLITHNSETIHVDF